MPRAPAARVVDIAKALIGGRSIPIKEIGIRPGEKIHEIMVSEEEVGRTVERDGFYAIVPMLPELRDTPSLAPVLDAEYPPPTSRSTSRASAGSSAARWPRPDGPRACRAF